MRLLISRLIIYVCMYVCMYVWFIDSMSTSKRGERERERERENTLSRLHAQYGAQRGALSQDAWDLDLSQKWRTGSSIQWATQVPLLNSIMTHLSSLLCSMNSAYPRDYMVKLYNVIQPPLSTSQKVTNYLSFLRTEGFCGTHGFLC